MLFSRSCNYSWKTGICPHTSKLRQARQHRRRHRGRHCVEGHGTWVGPRTVAQEVRECLSRFHARRPASCVQTVFQRRKHPTGGRCASVYIHQSARVPQRFGRVKYFSAWDHRAKCHVPDAPCSRSAAVIRGMRVPECSEVRERGDVDLRRSLPSATRPAARAGRVAVADRRIHQEPKADPASGHWTGFVLGIHRGIQAAAGTVKEYIGTPGAAGDVMAHFNDSFPCRPL